MLDMFVSGFSNILIINEQVFKTMKFYVGSNINVFQNKI